MEECLKIDSEWTQKTVDFIKSHTSLSEKQIYKWGYDKNRKGKYSNGIRDSIRENKRRKLNESDSSDYNQIVTELFLNEDTKCSKEPADLESKLATVLLKYIHDPLLSNEQQSTIALLKFPSSAKSNFSPDNMPNSNKIDDLYGEDHEFSSNFGDISDEYDKIVDFPSLSRFPSGRGCTPL